MKLNFRVSVTVPSTWEVSSIVFNVRSSIVFNVRDIGVSDRHATPRQQYLNLYLISKGKTPSIVSGCLKIRLLRKKLQI